MEGRTCPPYRAPAYPALSAKAATLERCPRGSSEAPPPLRLGDLGAMRPSLPRRSIAAALMSCRHARPPARRRSSFRERVDLEDPHRSYRRRSSRRHGRRVGRDDAGRCDAHPSPIARRRRGTSLAEPAQSGITTYRGAAAARRPEPRVGFTAFASSSFRPRQRLADRTPRALRRVTHRAAMIGDDCRAFLDDVDSVDTLAPPRIGRTAVRIIERVAGYGATVPKAGRPPAGR